MNQFYRNLAMWLIIVASVILMFNMLSMKDTTSDKISYSQFINAVEGGEVAEVLIQGSNITGVYNNV